MAKTVEMLWEDVAAPVYTNLKVYILTHYVDQVLKLYGNRIDMLVRKYARYLPYHVRNSEEDDLATVAKLEFIEALKVWDPEKCRDMWPIARPRIVGAMKDHIRYVTKSDPTRFYDWVNDAAQVFMAVQDRADFEHSIETGVELSRAMEVLEAREKRIVILHTKLDKTFKQIGEELGISESQISRIYKKSLEKIKKVLSK